MQHHHVVRGFDDGQVKLRVELGFFFLIAAGQGGFHLGEDRTNHGEVAFGAQPGRALGCQPFEIAAK